MTGFAPTVGLASTHPANMPKGHLQTVKYRNPADFAGETEKQ
jgi:hypothetical protein